MCRNFKLTVKFTGISIGDFQNNSVLKKKNNQRLHTNKDELKLQRNCSLKHGLTLLLAL